MNEQCRQKRSPDVWVLLVVLRVLLHRAVQDLRGEVVDGAQPVCVRMCATRCDLVV